MKKFTKKWALVLIFLFITGFAFAQSMQVLDYFNQVSATYAGITDYKALISMKVGSQSPLTGTIWTKGNKVLINWRTGEVININNGKLIVYVAGNRVVLEQEMTGLNAGSAEGLSLFRKYYKYKFSSPLLIKLV